MLSAKAVLLAVFVATCVSARPLPVSRLNLNIREVPQEHSHEKILTSVTQSLTTNNPDNIKDAVFGLLGNAAAQQGAGNIADATCLQQATADQAFTNAKAANDVEGMTNALIYRALERNSGSVGLKTDPCTSIKAKNPEIAAIAQHQDPASDGAAAANKDITLTLAKQIASVGGDPQRALDAGTFAPGDPKDSTGKGNTCDDQNDKEGCIFSQNLLVPDATADEIAAAAGGAAAGGAAGGAKNGAAAGGAAASGSAKGNQKAGAANNAASAASAGNAKNAQSGNANANSNSGADNANAGAGNANANAAAGASNAGTGGAAAGAAGAAGDFGSCSTPEIEFGAGFDNRKETSFQPVDKTSFNHGSAQNINIITQSICDTLTNSCKADQTAKDTCAKAQQAASAAPPKTGAQADAFNAAFGKQTNFAAVQAIDDQGKAVGAAAAAQRRAWATRRTTILTRQAAGDFGKCTTPEIEFGVGFDNRKETSFQPKDKQSFNHGSAQNINIITQFICDTLTNSCGADQAAKDQCTQAQQAASAATAKTGAQADAFNAVFGIQTQFTDIQAIDDQGKAVAGTGNAAGAANNQAAGAGQAGNAQAGNAQAGNAQAGNAQAGNAAAKGAAAQGNAGASQASGANAKNAAGAAANGAAAGAGNASAASGGNVQTFTGNLGGAPPPVVPGGKGFVVDGSEFINSGAALGRSCDVQHNACANAANSGGGFSVSDCDQQNNQCRAAIQA